MCGGGGDLGHVKNLACANLVGVTYTCGGDTIARGGHTTSTHPKPKESIGFWALAGRRGLSGRQGRESRNHAQATIIKQQETMIDIRIIKYQYSHFKKQEPTIKNA